MKKYLKKMCQGKAGFTFVEILIVVSIIVVLAGITAFSAVAMQRNSRQKELDTKAQLIYVAAQNRMSELKATGFASAYGADQAGVTAMPYHPLEEQQNKETLYYVTQSSGAASQILPAGQIDAEIRSNRWVIEYDVDSGSVYGVFYAEDTGVDMTESLNGLNKLRDRSLRVSNGAKIGYYGGETTWNAPTVTVQSYCAINNGETLTAELSFEKVEGNPYKVTKTPVFNITITDASGNTAQASRNASLTSRNGKDVYTATLDLDSLSSRFKDNWSGLKPGEDITLEVEVDSGNDLVKVTSSKSDPFNSLFDSVKGNTAYISCGRHLQNLDGDSGVRGLDSSKKITAAVQKASFDWNDATVTYFKAINNDYIKSYSGSCQEENSSETVYTSISNLTFNSDNSKNLGKIGLFANFSGTLKDITMIGTKGSSFYKTSGGYANAAGALVAYIGGKTDISGCQVYLDASTNLTSQPESNPYLTAIQAGGLIGKINSGKTVTITDCFAATIIGTPGSTGSMKVGGLVGYNQGNLTITNSYADCYLYARQAASETKIEGSVGGLVGVTDTQVTMKNCYAAGYLNCEGGYKYGLASNVNATYCYSVCSFGDTANQWGIAKEGSTVGCYYMANEAFSDNTLGESKLYAEMANTNYMNRLLRGGFKPSGASNPYRLLGQKDEKYPFLKLSTTRANAQYGDWENMVDFGSLAYYEVYDTSGSVRIKGLNYSTLLDETILGDGYGIITKTNKASVKVTINGTQYTLTGPYSAVLEQDTVYVYPLPKDVMSNADAFWTTASSEVQDTVDGKSATFKSDYQYCAAFAGVLHKGSNSGAAVPERLSLRTPRQFWVFANCYEKMMASDSTATKNFAGATILQEEDFLFGTESDTYNWAKYTNLSAAPTTFTAIGSSAYPFCQTYDGRCKYIGYATFTANGIYGGLFGNNTGDIYNVFLMQDTLIYKAQSGSSYVGPLVGRNAGTVNNCAVGSIDYQINAYTASYLYIGGLAGENIGTISKCAVAAEDLTVSSANYATIIMGGLVGSNGTSSANGTVESSYIQGVETVKNVNAGSVFMGGLAGSNSVGTLTDSYAAVAMVTDGNTKTYGIAPNGGIVTSCSYLAGNAEDDRVYAYGEESTAGIYTFAKSTKTGAKNMETMQETLLISEGGKIEGDESYPYTAIVTDRNGELYHPGKWFVPTNLGSLGVMYWEHEVGGSNEGYHFRYISVEGSTVSDDKDHNTTLCTAHDDGGVIREYGYGYYYKEKDGAVTLKADSRLAMGGSANSTASSALTNMLSGYKVMAYVTTTNTGTGGYLYGNASMADSGGDKSWYSWNITRDNYTLNTTINPFFGNSISSAQNDSTLGTTESNHFEIRSDDQLQYLNWNSYTKNCTTDVAGSPTDDWYDNLVSETNENVNIDKGFTYLKYSIYNKASSSISTWNYYWVQTHDVNRESESFHPIGGLYDRMSGYNGASDLDMFGLSKSNVVYFAGSFNGNDYIIKNIAINSYQQTVGLFGVTMGARLSNIVMYSDNDDVIRHGNIGSTKTRNWYCIGALVGFAGEGTANPTGSVFESCVAAGYVIKDDNNQNVGFGGASVGGLVGATNMDMSHCVATNDIILNITDNHDYTLIRFAHVGGLVGGARCFIHDCYSGGSITNNSTESTAQGYRLWFGGICGGAVLKDDTNIVTLVGATDSAITNANLTASQRSDTGLVIRNCYSYTTMPKDGGIVQGSYSIASSGMLMSTESPLEGNLLGYWNRTPKLNLSHRITHIFDSYRLDDTMVNTTDWIAYQNNPDINVSNWTIAERIGKYFHRWSTRQEWTVEVVSRTGYTFVHNSHSPFVSYDEMASDEFVGWMNANSMSDRAWAKVTTKDADGMDIPGRYSYYASVKSLEGTNYPFPTIMQVATEVAGSKANVHYGAWPTGGLWWDTHESVSVNYNILRYWNDATGNAVVTIPLRAQGQADPNASIDISTEGIVNVPANRPADGNVVIELLKPGNVIVTAHSGTTNVADAALYMNVTAELTLEADGTNVENMKRGQTVKGNTVTLQMPSTVADGAATDYTGAVTWEVLSSNPKVAVGEMETGNKSFSVTAKGPGTTVLTVKASVTLGATTYSFSYPVPVTVADPGVLGIANFKIADQGGLWEYDLENTDSTIAAASYPEDYSVSAPAANDAAYAIYFRGDTVTADTFSVTGIKLKDKDAKEITLSYSSEHECWLDSEATYSVTIESESANPYYYKVFTLLTEKMGPFDVTFTVTDGTKEYTLSLTGEQAIMPMRTVQFFDGNDVWLGTIYVLQGDTYTLTQSIVENWDTLVDPLDAESWEDSKAIGCTIEVDTTFKMKAPTQEETPPVSGGE